MQIERSDFQDQLMRGLTHRMNNILAVFHGHVGILLDDKRLSPDALDALHLLKKGAQSATELMNRAHSIVRPPALVWREIDLGEFVRLLRPGFASMHGPNTIIEIDAAPDLPRVWADAKRLRIAIFELVRNACEATVEGGRIQIQLQAEQTGRVFSAASQSGCWVSLKVIDNGLGVPIESQGKIFAPFFSLKHESSAFGLGLTVALGFAEQLGGTIRYQSERGRTQFEMLLPSRRSPR
ncbi:MAG: hybrid sensor histidine kinase/response regulator [Chthoniobacteraceae bacterium]|nr:hybrid sensor histidine kinase/response regulator [Chthoniobacteraceae bacterium]